MPARRSTLLRCVQQSPLRAELPMELLDEMVVFARVVDSGGFTAAARVLGLTNSAVSRSVARLESQLGARLLNRTTRSVSLTELGAEVYPGCARLAQTAREVQALAGRYALMPQGRVRVTAPTVFGEVWLAPLLPAFLARWPRVQVDLTLIDRMVDLVDEGHDLALRITRPGAVAPGLVARVLMDMRYVMVATPDYLRRHGAPSEPSGLAAHDCIGLDFQPLEDRLAFGPPAGHAATAASADPWLVPVRCPLRVNNSSAILATVEAGLGIGIVPDFAAAAGLRARRLKAVLPRWPLAGAYAPRVVHAVYTPTRHLPAKVRVLIDHLAAAAAAPATGRARS
jgi:DNA-binding transcriptional LysR family regulator